MGWILVRQPDGRIARFSGVVDDFTDYGMDRGEAISLCLERGLTPLGAEDKVAGAEHDLAEDGLPSGTGAYRWEKALKTIRAVHGQAYLEQTLGKLSGEPTS